ncbi:MAG: hypothetical protein Ct9H300mP18_07860 [Candidatus Neomarinimicrobiota bacterium]|nr:MAG: hypothetical protein Ct9H300mP18_07860 [Candidatus Neomarinimicrobiota bacterium]
MLVKQLSEYSLFLGPDKSIRKTIDSENSSDRRVQWDLRNSFNIPVASGMYVAHLSMEDARGIP